MTTVRALAGGAWRAALALFLVTLLSWSLVDCAPGTSAERAAVASRTIVPGDLSLAPSARAELIATATRDFELEHSPLRRALAALRLDFGVSWQDGEPASLLVVGKGGATTLTLVLGALALAFAMGLWGAAASARRQEALSARAWALFAAVALSVPLPWLAMVAIDALAYGRPLSLFPPGGTSGGGGLVLPILVMALAPAAVIWRHAHEEMLRLSRESWVVAARARGNTEARIWRGLILRASLPQLLPLIPVLVAYLLAASVIVERVFALQGVGERLARAAELGDVPTLIAFAALAGLGISVSTTLVDVVIRHLDPRRRSS